MAGSKTTTSHAKIRRWAEDRDGHPAKVTGTGEGEDPGILRIDFDEPGGNDDARLERIGWDEFFEKFDEKGLSFLYQEKDGDGKTSRFSKFVGRETAGSGSRSREKATARR